MSRREKHTYMLMYVLTLTCHFFVFCALTPHDTVCGTLFVLCVSMWPYLSEVDMTGFPAVEQCVHNTQSRTLSSRCTFNILSQLWSMHVSTTVFRKSLRGGGKIMYANKNKGMDWSMDVKSSKMIYDIIYTVWVFCTAIHWWRWLYSHRNVWITVKRGLVHTKGSWLIHLATQDSTKNDLAIMTLKLVLFQVGEGGHSSMLSVVHNGFHLKIGTYSYSVFQYVRNVRIW